MSRILAFIVSLIVLVLGAEGLSAYTQTLTLVQPSSPTNVQDCNGLRFQAIDTIGVAGFAHPTYSLMRDGVSSVDTAGSAGGLIPNFQSGYYFYSPPLPGVYTVVRHRGNNSPVQIGGAITVSFKPGVTCPNRPIRDYGGDMWFNGPTSASRPVVGDFDNDHHEDDIAYFGLCSTPAHNCIRVHFGTGSSEPATERGGDMWFFTDGPIGSPAVGDLDGDGYRDDIVYYGRCGVGFACLRAHFSNGTTFNSTQLGWDVWPADETPNSALMVGDFDNDGKNDDVIYSGRCGSGGQRCWRAHMG